MGKMRRTQNFTDFHRGDSGIVCSMEIKNVTITEARTTASGRDRRIIEAMAKEENLPAG